MLTKTIIVTLLATYTRSQDAGCDFSQNLEKNKVYYVYSPRYPYNYTAGSQCRWIAYCPSDCNCRLDCSEINLPQSSSCSMDRILISRRGDPQLAGAEYYCGRGVLSAISTGTSLSIGLISSYYSPGGRFACQLTAQLSTKPETCSCGYKKLNRIVGGEETKPNEYPMMAGIIYTDEGLIKCGAVIIDKRYVLTAAHCLYGRTNNRLQVVVGKHDIRKDYDTAATRFYNISSFTIHPQYDNANYNNDIAVVAVTEDIRFSESVGPVCLPFKFVSKDFAGDKATLLGWGTLFIGGPTSKTLRKVEVDVITQASCSRSVSTLTTRQMCTYTPGKDSCQDDSGGPVLYTDPSTGRLFNIGIVSFGKSCASRDPAVNTRITAYLDWIVSNTRANFCRA